MRRSSLPAVLALTLAGLAATVGPAPAQSDGSGLRAESSERVLTDCPTYAAIRATASSASRAGIRLTTSRTATGRLRVAYRLPGRLQLCRIVAVRRSGESQPSPARTSRTRGSYVDARSEDPLARLVVLARPRAVPSPGLPSTLSGASGAGAARGPLSALADACPFTVEVQADAAAPAQSSLLGTGRPASDGATPAETVFAFVPRRTGELCGAVATTVSGEAFAPPVSDDSVTLPSVTSNEAGVQESGVRSVTFYGRRTYP